MLQQFCTGQQLYSFASIRASKSFSPQHFDLHELINHNNFVIQVVNHKLTITIVDKKKCIWYCFKKTSTVYNWILTIKLYITYTSDFIYKIVVAICLTMIASLPKLLVTEVTAEIGHIFYCW